MRKREIIFAVIVSIMILCNIIGTVAVVVVNVTSGRDLVKECLMFFAPETPTNRQMIPVKEEWTIPTQPQTEPIEEHVMVETEPVVQTTEHPIENTVEENILPEKQSTETTVPELSETMPLEDYIEAVG